MELSEGEGRGKAYCSATDFADRPIGEWQWWEDDSTITPRQEPLIHRPSLNRLLKRHERGRGRHGARVGKLRPHAATSPLQLGGVPTQLRVSAPSLLRVRSRLGFQEALACSGSRCHQCRLPCRCWRATSSCSALGDVVLPSLSDPNFRLPRGGHGHPSRRRRGAGREGWRGEGKMVIFFRHFIEHLQDTRFSSSSHTQINALQLAPLIERRERGGVELGMGHGTAAEMPVARGVRKMRLAQWKVERRGAAAGQQCRGRRMSAGGGGRRQCRREAQW
ncbi:hypothetical protein ACP70R_037031 [Stipagrostis hirtigluma subsp. patula]